MESIDVRKLLEKYMRVVVENEGVTFVEHAEDGYFSAEELRFLDDVKRAVLRDYRGA